MKRNKHTKSIFYIRVHNKHKIVCSDSVSREILKNWIPDETMGVKLNIDNGGSGENSLSNYAMYKPSTDHQDIFNTPQKGYLNNNIKPYTSVILNDLTGVSKNPHAD